MRVVLLSLEPWDQVWRRNQHFVLQLVQQGLASSVVFVEPPVLRGGAAPAREVADGVTAYRPVLQVPKRAGGIAMAGRGLRRTVVREADVLWVNDAGLGIHSRARSTPTVYDVTDDWREFASLPRIRRRLVRAEDSLARTARTVVCSDVLRTRWSERYGVDATVVRNGVDLCAVGAAAPVQLSGPGPNVGYVGTLHQERLDLDLVELLARDGRVAQVHLVGPDALSPAARERLRLLERVTLHGPVPAAEVPRWTKAMDVLICPHVVTSFTLSLDAIKASEYLASGRPVVATPTSGFELLSSPGVEVVRGAAFVEAVVTAPFDTDWGPRGAVDWSERARAFGEVLVEAQRC